MIWGYPYDSGNPHIFTSLHECIATKVLTRVVENTHLSMKSISKPSSKAPSPALEAERQSVPAAAPGPTRVARPAERCGRRSATTP